MQNIHHLALAIGTSMENAVGCYGSIISYFPEDNPKFEEKIQHEEKALRNW